MVSCSCIYERMHLHFSCRKEIRIIFLAGMFRAVNLAFFYVSLGVVNLLMFSTFTLATGNSLTPSIVFTTLSLTQSLRVTTISFMVVGIFGLQEAKVAFTRIQVSCSFVCPAVCLSH